MEELAVAGLLAAINNRIIEWFAVPAKRHYPRHDFWWLLYGALATGALLSWASGINLFDDFLPNPLVGRILTAIVVGGGSNLIHEITNMRGGTVIEAPRATSVESVTTGTVEGNVVTGGTAKP